MQVTRDYSHYVRAAADGLQHIHLAVTEHHRRRSLLAGVALMFCEHIEGKFGTDVNAFIGYFPDGKQKLFP